MRFPTAVFFPRHKSQVFCYTTRTEEQEKKQE